MEKETVFVTPISSPCLSPRSTTLMPTTPPLVVCLVCVMASRNSTSWILRSLRVLFVSLYTQKSLLPLLRNSPLPGETTQLVLINSSSWDSSTIAAAMLLMVCLTTSLSSTVSRGSLGLNNFLIAVKNKRRKGGSLWRLPRLSGFENTKIGSPFRPCKFLTELYACADAMTNKDEALLSTALTALWARKVEPIFLRLW